MNSRPFSQRSTPKTSPRRNRPLRLEPLEARSLLATASLEPLFGENGLVEVPVFRNEGTLDWAERMVQQADGKLLLLGLSFSGDPHPAVVRLLPDGARDESFGVDGVTLVTSHDVRTASSIAVQPDGKVLVGVSSDQPFLVRLNSDGSLDEDFGSGGFLPWTYSAGNVQQIIVQEDGKLLIGAGTALGRFAVTRITADGALDGSYGNQGTGNIESGQPFQAFEYALLPDGMVVAAGRMTSGGIDSLVVGRLGTDGLWDKTFGNAGWQITPMGRSYSTVSPTDAYDLAIAPDGSMAVVGTWLTPDDAVTRVVRLTRDGLVDSSFDGDGIADLFLGESTISGGIAVLQDGSVLVAGHYGPHSGASQHFLAKLTSQGQLDTSWAQGGVSSKDFSDSFDTVKELLVLEDAGRILTLTETYSEQGQTDLGVSKWLANGAPDLSFGGTGLSSTDVTRPTSVVWVERLVALSGGDVMLLGRSGAIDHNDISVLRFSPGGDLLTNLEEGGFRHFPDAAYPGVYTSQVDGKLIVVQVESTGHGYHVFPKRYLTNGSIDPTFSPDQSLPGSADYFQPYLVMVQRDGKVLVVSSQHTHLGVNKLTRYLSDGQLDLSFGTEGTVSLPDAQAQVISVVEHGGSLYLSMGGSYFDPSRNSYFRAANQLRRIDASGVVDSTFGGAGSVSLVDQMNWGAELLLDREQSLVAVTGSIAQRFLLDGTPDESFAVGGALELPAGSTYLAELQGAAIDPGGNLYLTRDFYTPGEDNLEFLRVRSDGSIDTAFSAQASQFIRSADFINYQGLTVQGSEITVAGTTRSGVNTSFQLLRLRMTEHAAWQNPVNRLNVDGDPDNNVVPMDALIIINALHRFGPRPLSSDGPSAGELYLDVSGDGYLSAIDALMIINYLHANPVSSLSQSGDGQAEGESDGRSDSVAQLNADDDDDVLEDSLGATGITDEDLACLLWTFENGRERKER